jgi:Protein of unknown function (DUF3168)
MALADIRVGLRAYLLDDAAIAAIVGTRVYPIVLPQGQVQTSIVYTRISGFGDNHMLGPSGLSRPRIQIDCWSQSIDTAAQLANLVKERIDGFLGTWLWGEDSPEEAIVVQGVFYENEREDYDDVSKLYRVSRDFFVWVSEK